MRKIFILSILLILSCGYAYGGEIIQITNDGANYDYQHPVVGPQGHVWWWRQPSSLMLYNGSIIQTIPYTRHNEPTWEEFSRDHAVDLATGQTVYVKNNEIYLFDGNIETQITNDGLTKIEPTISNGFITWYAQRQIFLYKPDQPTAVNMSALKATPANKAVKLNWQTETEMDTAGFNVWRAEAFQKVNTSIIPAEGSPAMGAGYDFFDRWVMNGKLYYYLVEDVDNDGISTFHGPVKAVPRWWYGVGK